MSKDVKDLEEALEIFKRRDYNESYSNTSY